jgi:hypothetical protein
MIVLDRTRLTGRLSADLLAEIAPGNFRGHRANAAAKKRGFWRLPGRRAPAALIPGGLGELAATVRAHAVARQTGAPALRKWGRPIGLLPGRVTPLLT